jgi:hypothetical protein
MILVTDIQKSLRRDAPDIQTGSSELAPLLNADSAETQLGSFDGRHVASGSASNYSQIELLDRKGSSNHYKSNYLILIVVCGFDDCVLDLLQGIFDLRVLEHVSVGLEDVVVDFVLLLQKLSDVGDSHHELVLGVFDAVWEVDLFDQLLVFLEVGQHGFFVHAQFFVFEG